MPSPTLHNDHGLAQRVEDLAVEKLVAQPGVDRQNRLGMQSPANLHAGLRSGLSLNEDTVKSEQLTD